ncbi:MAG: PP2C family protein-serine/threonine phosphatase [Clostridia bacterium]|nr:PP2C family protein-serine/threonine phosphatase [Clostridia bacterium]
MAVTALWTLAVLLASAFSAVLTGITLTPKYKGLIRGLVWGAGTVIGYGIAFLSYSINLYNDFVGIIVLSAMVCAISQILYKDTWSTKLTISLMGCLIANVSTFMFCGTTDSLLAPLLGLINESAYEVGNILFFIGIKIVVYTVLTLLYVKFLRGWIHTTIETVSGKMTLFIPALVVSVVGFYIINLFSNSLGIYPNTTWFFPLYLTVCVIFVIEFWMIFYSINQSAKTMKTSAELNVAANIQKSMLPCIFPAFPDREDFDIYASMDPAKEVGGDFYDFFMVDDTHVAVVMADVSGKGIPAALFMVIGKTLIKDHTQPGRDLGEIFTEVNKLLCESNSEGLFITAFEGVIDLETGKFTYVNAGHEMPCICKAGGEFTSFKVPHGFVLAGMETVKYHSGEIQLDEGDMIFLHTDGVTEATDAKYNLYGKERMLAVLNENKDKPLNEILSSVKADIDNFAQGVAQFDDITMLCFKLKYKTGEL